MGISHTISSLYEVMSLLSLFVRGGKTHKDKMTSNHTAFHLTIIPFIIKRNQSVSCRLDTTFTEARNHYFESLHNTSYSYNRNKI